MRRFKPLLSIGRLLVPTHLWAERERWVVAGEVAEGDDEIGGREGAREGAKEVEKSGGKGRERSLVAP